MKDDKAFSKLDAVSKRKHFKGSEKDDFSYSFPG